MARNKTCCSGISPTRQPQLLFRSITRFGRSSTIDPWFRRESGNLKRPCPTLLPPETTAHRSPKWKRLNPAGWKTNGFLDGNFLEGQGSSRDRFRAFLPLKFDFGIDRETNTFEYRYSFDPNYNFVQHDGYLKRRCSMNNTRLNKYTFSLWIVIQVKVDLFDRIRSG